MIVRPKERALTFIAEISQAELAVRLMAVAVGLRRPADSKKAPDDLIAEAHRNWPADAGDFPFLRMAAVAVEYLRECIDRGQRPS